MKDIIDISTLLAIAVAQVLFVWLVVGIGIILTKPKTDKNKEVNFNDFSDKP